MKLHLLILFLGLFSISSAFSQDFNNLITEKNIDSFFLENKKATSIKTEWGFTFIHQDSIHLKKQISKLLNKNYSSSDVYKVLEEDDPKNLGYVGYFGIDLIENKLYNANQLHEKYVDLINKTKEIGLSIIGFYVAEQLDKTNSEEVHYQSENSASLVIYGKIYDIDKENIPYVNIGLFEKNIGTVSDIQGKFTLEIPKKYLNNKITFSCIGYKTVHIPVIFFLNHSIKSRTEVCMEKNVESLDEVIVSIKQNSKKSKRKTLGVKNVNKNQSGFIFGKSGGAEIARLIKNDKKIRINSISIFIGNNKEDSFILRANLYSVDKESNQPRKNLLGKPIIIESTLNSGWLDISLDEVLIVDSSFYVSFEWIDKNIHNPVVALSKKRFSKNYSVQRSVSHGKWIKSVDFDWAIKCEVIY